MLDLSDKKIQLEQITDSEDFWCLVSELINDQSEFLYNKDSILEAFKTGNLYSLSVFETDEMFRKVDRRDEIFCKDTLNDLFLSNYKFNDILSFYLLPCFCIKNDDNCAIILWVHSRARNKGLGRKLVELLGIRYAFRPLPKSIGFWEKCNVEIRVSGVCDFFLS